MEATFNQSWGRRGRALPHLLNEIFDAPEGQFRGERRGGRGRGRGVRGEHRMHGEGPRGHRGGLMGRPGRARRGDVRIAALLLIAEEPRNGYQIIQELESRTDGRWKPSPGAIYPALNQLEDEGLIRPSEAQTGNAFEITDAGREQAQSVEKAPWESANEAKHPAGDLGKNYGQVWAAVQAVAETRDETLIGKANDELSSLKKKLYQLLADS